MRGQVFVCSFGSTDEIKGLNGTRKLRGAAAERVYEALKKTVLKAGMFSVFESTSSMRAADMFGRLHKDPELQIFPMAFPWTGIKRIGGTP